MKINLESVSKPLLAMGVTMALAAIMTFSIDFIPNAMEVSAIAKKDIKANRNYEIVDAKATENLREEASSSIRPVFDFNSNLEQVKNIRQAFVDARESISKGDLPDRLKESFLGKSGFVLSEDEYAMILRSKFSPGIENALAFLVHQVMSAPIVDKKVDLQSLVDQGFTLRPLDPEIPEQTIHELKNILELGEARQFIAKIKAQDLPDLEAMRPQDFRFFKQIALSFIKVNLSFNSEETEMRKDKARKNIKEAIIKIKHGESIIRSGDRFEPWHLVVLGGIEKSRKSTNRYLKFLSTFLFINLVLLIVYSFAEKHIRKFNPTRTDLVFLGSALIVSMLLLRVGLFISSSFRDALPFSLDGMALHYGIPIAAGAMLVRFILNSETALIFAIILSILTGMYLEASLPMAVYFLMGSLFAAYAVAQVDRRSTLLLSGLYLGFANAAIIFCLNGVSLVSTPEVMTFWDVLINMGFGVLGGIFSAMIVLVMTPVCEVFFNYTTDIKLLELANLSHPLLKQMIVESPGTYHHSQLVGILAEAAAREIAANPLLARVACYYHDIGKMKKPHYFIENQRGGPNPHDRIHPITSAGIIESHVRDGIEMAKLHKLPQKISDMIPQHQGTKIIGYFYDKAKKAAELNGEPINVDDFRYPGPKPQTREAGIIILADTVEAAVRSMPEKTPEKMRSMVEKLVNQHFVDEQLDECDLTLRDLHAIANSFCKILNGIYHQRVEYPEDDSLSQQRTSQKENITHLFRKKDSANF